MKQPKILVSLPLYGGVCYDRFLNSWTDLMTWGYRNDVEFTLQVISNESLLPRARNLGVAKLLDHRDRFSHILFVDGDMGFRPYRFERLLYWDKPMVGCPGPVKFIYWGNVYDAMLKGHDVQSHALRYAVNLLDGDGFKAENGFTRVRDMGCCFFLAKTEAVVELAERNPQLKCSGMSHVNGLPLNSQNQYTLFDSTKDEAGRYLECDHAFMCRWRQLGDGHDIWADMTGDLAHVGLYHFMGSMAQYYFGTEMTDRIDAQISNWGHELPPKPEETTPETEQQPAAATMETTNG
jgi:hypothetical protein